MQNLPKVTFGIVNCNRLFYLKSCVESLLYCTEDYPNKEIIIVDNASNEEGTEEYLREKGGQGIKVFRQQTRDPSNEFAHALNLIVRESTGDFVCPLQGDMQFVIKGKWLHEYVNFFQENDKNIGCILFDAQRSVRNSADKFSDPMGQQFKFVYSLIRNPINGAADVMYSRKIIEQIYPWNESNMSHEGGEDSETKMVKKVSKIITDHDYKLFCTLPILPVSVAINTDPRGTNARVRGNKRYGAYWPAKVDYRYYEIYEFDKAQVLGQPKHFDPEAEPIPIGIEHIANPVGWKKPVDAGGNWLKNPIDPKIANPSDYTILYEDTTVSVTSEEYLDEWLNSE
jgi:glycosyltransferase involved in cell wall biosynthesis